MENAKINAMSTDPKKLQVQVEEKKDGELTFIY